jgi:FKBP-type peptidyl-prolyl cis-trans isomerase 2
MQISILEKYQPARMNKVMPLILFILLCFATFAYAAADSIVQAGDVAEVRFVCSLKNGEIAATTDMEVERDSKNPKSSIYLPLRKDGPVSVMASVALPWQETGREKAFEEEIADRLAGIIAGMKEGERRTARLEADDIPGRGEEDYLLRVAQIRKRPKELKMTKDEYQIRTGKSPEEGQVFSMDPAIPGRVAAISEDEVFIIFSALSGDKIKTPFGPGNIRETEDSYEIVIDAVKGTLVRTGPLVGRIVDVDEQVIKIDYRNPFGGETLICDISVERVASLQPGTHEPGE